jgi:hypothetical protein
MNLYVGSYPGAGSDGAAINCPYAVDGTEHGNTASESNEGDNHPWHTYISPF